MDLEVHTGNLPFAVARVVARALAQLGESNVPGLAELYTCRNQQAVYLDTGPPLEFEKHIDYARIAGSSAQHPSATSQDAPRESANQPRRFLGRNGSHLQHPGEDGRIASFGL